MQNLQIINPEFDHALIPDAVRPYLEGMTDEKVSEFLFCFNSYLQHRRSAIASLSYMILNFGWMMECLGTEKFNEFCPRVLNISKVKKSRWIAAYHAGKQKFSGAEGYFDCRTFARLSYSGLKLIEDASDEVIAEIQTIPGDGPIPTKKIEEIIKKADERVAEANAAMEQALADRQSAERRAERAINDANRLQERLASAETEKKLADVQYQRDLDDLTTRLGEIAHHRDEVIRENNQLRLRPPETVQVEVEVERVPRQYRDLEDAIAMKTNTLNAVKSDIMEKEVQANELNQRLAETEDAIREEQSLLQKLSEERSTIESLFKSLDSLIANFPQTLIHSIDRSNAPLMKRMKIYGETLIQLGNQLKG